MEKDSEKDNGKVAVGRHVWHEVMGRKACNKLYVIIIKQEPLMCALT